MGWRWGSHRQGWAHGVQGSSILGQGEPLRPGLMEKEVLEVVGRSELHKCPQADTRALAKWIGHLQGMECEVASLKKWQLPEIVYYWGNSPLILIKVKGSSSKEKRSHQMHTPSTDSHPTCWLWGPVPAGCSPPSHQAEQGPAPPPEAAPLPPKNLIPSVNHRGPDCSCQVGHGVVAGVG